MDGRGRMELVIGKKNRRDGVTSHRIQKARRSGAGQAGTGRGETPLTRTRANGLSDKSERNQMMDPPGEFSEPSFFGIHGRKVIN